MATYVCIWEAFDKTIPATTWKKGNILNKSVASGKTAVKQNGTNVRLWLLAWLNKIQCKNEM